MSDSTRALHDLGQRLWLDDLSRPLLSSGLLARRIGEWSITGLTSNPTIFERAIGGSDAYDAAIGELAGAGLDDEALFFELALDDIVAAADLFRLIFEASGGADGWVSLEVSPLLADDTMATAQAAVRLHERAARANVLIKIPGTAHGNTAIEQAVFDGVPVNVTLLFSREHAMAAAGARASRLLWASTATKDPAGLGVTDAVEAAANAYLDARLRGVRRMPVEQARAAATTHRHDYLGNYVEDLGDVVDLAAVRAAGVRIGVDPMGGAGVAYWPAIAERWRLDLTVIDDSVDPTFAFVAPGADGIVRMDPASAHAMRRLIAVRDRFDIALACDTDHDRHGIVTPAAGLLPADHFLVVAIDHLFRHRPCWPATAAIGKTVVSTWMIDRVAAELGRRVHEVPVGFKWFSAGLCDAGLGFAGEESAGASFLRRDGTAWTTDKDGIAAALLAAEILAVGGRDPGARYRALTERLGDPVAGRIDAPATAAQKDRLAKLSSASIDAVTLAGEPVTAVRDRALGNGALIGGVQVVSAHGWYVARASGTEHLYKIYAESFFGADHLRCILDEARTVVDAALSTATLAPNGQHDRNDSGATGRRAASAV